MLLARFYGFRLPHILLLSPPPLQLAASSNTLPYSAAMAAIPPSSQSQAVHSGDLVDLVSSSTAATVHPSDDTILSVLQARFRQDQAYSRISAQNLIVVNPYKTLASVNDLSAQEYEERSYKDTSLPLPGAAAPLPPHIYDLAARVYLLMRRRKESQSVIFRYFHCFSVRHGLTICIQRHHRVGEDIQFSITRQPGAAPLCSLQKGVADSGPDTFTHSIARLIRQRQDTHES